MNDGLSKPVLTKRETLRAMGIEVWSLRPAMPASSVAAPQSSASMAPIDALRAQLAPQDNAPRNDGDSPAVAVRASKDDPLTGAAAEAQEVPSFRYALLHYDSVGVCVSLSENANLPRRLCDDIARLLGGDIQAARFQELKWPMLANSGIDQSLSAARQVVTEKFRLLPQKVIVIGADVGRCFKPVEDIEHMSHGKFGSQNYFLIDSAEALVSSSAEKKRLMMALLAWR